jgi:hypothetical protein
MSSLTEPIHIIDGITNKVDKLAIVAFARQMIVKLCRDNPGKWVSVASYDPFSCGTSLFNINSRKKIFNPYGQHELQRNKNGAGKLSQQRILIVDGGFLYTERGQRGQGEQKLVQWLDHSMRVIKERFPHLTELIVRADGAGCYKGKFCRLASMTLGM